MFNAEAVVFYIISLFAIIAACFAITSHKNLSSIINSVITFLCVGFLLFALEMPLNAIVFILLFVVFLPLLFIVASIHTQKETEEPKKHLSFGKGFGIVGVFFLIFVISLFIKLGVFNNESFINGVNNIIPSSVDLSADLLVHYGIPLLFLSLLFTVAVIGADILIPVNERKGK